MKVIVTGGREYRDGALVRRVLSSFHSGQPIARLCEGGAGGADKHAKEWRDENGVPGKSYTVTPEEWRHYGKAAGPIRNGRMLREESPDVVIAFPGGRGTADMVKQAKTVGVEVLVIKETTC